MSEEAIKAYQGREFIITLRSASGTNYVWCLTSMPKEVALATVNSTMTVPRPGAPIDTTFTFFALADGEAKVGFKLLCWSKPEEEAEEVFFDVNIIPHNEEDGLVGFIRYSENAASYNIPPYGYNGVSTSVEKYGFPGCVKYGYPNCDSQLLIVDYGYPNCVKYGYPGCNEDQPAFKYGYLGCNEDRPALKYGYPGSNEDQPALKYGYPCCNEDQLAFKYGYPCCDNNQFASPRQLYSYPGCDSAVQPLYGYPPVKYGYPGCDFQWSLMAYGYPGCVKYGYPGCR